MNKIRDGDLFKVVTVFGKRFELRYGYYEEYERRHGTPIPIYPNFKETPEYTSDGRPFVTQMQEQCKYGSSNFEEGLCVDCPYYRHGDDLIGICMCNKNKKEKCHKSDDAEYNNEE